MPKLYSLPSTSRASLNDKNNGANTKGASVPKSGTKEKHRFSFFASFFSPTGQVSKEIPTPIQIPSTKSLDIPRPVISPNLDRSSDPAFSPDPYANVYFVPEPNRAQPLNSTLTPKHISLPPPPRSADEFAIRQPPNTPSSPGTDQPAMPFFASRKSKPTKKEEPTPYEIWVDPRTTTARASAPELDIHPSRPKLPVRAATVPAPPVRIGDLDKIDELDETGPIAMHHDGPYEAARKVAQSQPTAKHNVWQVRHFDPNSFAL